jgi:hypothetical protein
MSVFVVHHQRQEGETGWTVVAERPAYSSSARRITSDSVSPRSFATARARSQSSGATRIVRCGVFGWLGIARLHRPASRTGALFAGDLPNDPPPVALGGRGRMCLGVGHRGIMPGVCTPVKGRTGAS